MNQLVNKESEPGDGHEEEPAGASPGQRVITRQVSTSFKGPLPPPEVLEQFDRVVPGSAERIIAMAEQQSQHRRALEQKVISSDILNSRLGLIFGFVLGLVGVGGGIYAIVIGQAGVGSFISLGALATLAGVFVYGSKQRKSEREARERD